MAGTRISGSYLSWLCATLVAVAPVAHAVTYGTYEARGLAMAGTTVALATPQQAQFYNPALLAFHGQRAEDSRAGRLYVPVVSAQTSEAVLDVAAVAEDDLEQRIRRAVADFNAHPTPATARLARAEAAELDRVVDRLDEEGMSAEGFAGIALVEPDKKAGGGFHLGLRVIAGVEADVTDDDRERLDDYLDTFDYLIGTQAGPPPHPELFDDEGELIDPTDTVESTVSGRGAAIIEWGVTAAREFELAGWPLAVGVTPKFMEVRVYEELDHVVDTGIQSLNDAQSELTGNFDLGLATELESLRMGLAVKDVLRQTFKTDQGGEVILRPRARAGVAYVRERYSLGLDLDLLTNEPVGFEGEVREFSVGGEFRPASWLDLRLGYKYDLRQSDSGTVTAGAGFHIHRFLLDVGYSEYNDNRSAALQLGFAF